MSPTIKSSDRIGELKIGIAAARFNSHITNSMFDRCHKRLLDLGVAKGNITVARVPGSFELPYAIKSLIVNNDLNAAIALGAVIKGQTSHFLFISQAVSQGLSTVSIETSVPVIFGVLTTDNTEQALARIKMAVGYAESAVEMGSKIFDP
jgi:6,7-dimethyl-8-ribityllumazine synthase